MEPRQRAAFVGAYTKVLTSAWSNEAYAALLAADPRAALAEKGLEAPAGATITIIRETAGEPDLEAQVRIWEAGDASGNYQLVVPAAPQINTQELSESDLDAVSGGDNSYCCCCTPCCSCT